jgi:hypothetical protein
MSAQCVAPITLSVGLSGRSVTEPDAAPDKPGRRRENVLRRHDAAENTTLSSVSVFIVLS